jgi:hypothetical protein
LDTFGSKEKGIPAVSYDFQILPGTHKWPPVLPMSGIRSGIRHPQVMPSDVPRSRGWCAAGEFSNLFTVEVPEGAGKPDKQAGSVYEPIPDYLKYK